MTKIKNVNPILGSKELADYLLDAGQRTVLFWDVMRRRGNQYLEHMAKQSPTCCSSMASWSWTAARCPDP